MQSPQINPVHQCECSVCREDSDHEVYRYHESLNRMLSVTPERQSRLMVGALCQQPGGPSERELSLITGMSRNTIQRGREELACGYDDLPASRQRHEGGGRLLAEKKTLNWKH